MSESKQSQLATLLKDPGKTVLAVLVVSAVVTLGVVHLPFTERPTYGAQMFLASPDALALKGQEIYYEEGCQYCHSQNLRPLPWEVARFTKQDAYGFFPLPNPNEYNFETPAMRGGARLGPDLSRLASRMSEDELTALLKSSKTDSLRAGHHRFEQLFSSEAGMSGVLLSWRLRMMLNARSLVSDPLQRSVFDQIEGRTRGEALVAYLRTLGARQAEFAGKYYRK